MRTAQIWTTTLVMLGVTALLAPTSQAVPAVSPASATAVVEALAGGTDHALAEAAAHTSALGITTYAVVLDRATGRTLAQTDNATTAVASESLVKLLIAAWYLTDAEGEPSADLSASLRTMISASDDMIASSLFEQGQVTQMAQRYGLTGTAEPADGRWGSTSVTAADLARFLWLSSRDPLVGPFLLDAMGATTAIAADGVDQAFGVQALGDVVGSKQGWGSDNWHSGQPNAVHSVGFTDDLVIVDLQTGVDGTYWSMPSTAVDTVAAVAGAASTTDRFQSALESVTAGPGLIRVTGWAVDTSAAELTVPIRITAARSTGSELFPPVTGSSVASRPRADVPAATGISGAHGFEYDLGVVDPGRYEVCVTVRGATGPTTIALVGCSSVTVAQGPVHDAAVLPMASSPAS